MAILNLPIAVPWKLIAASPDKMNTKFCLTEYVPLRYSPSLAISAFEPKIEDLPPEFCNQRISYIKITCSISGLNYNLHERETIRRSFAHLSTEDLNGIINEYFGCYGAQLRVSVNPHPDDTNITKHESVDFGQFAPNPSFDDPYQAGDAVFSSQPETNEIISWNQDQKGLLFISGGLVQGEIPTVSVTFLSSITVHDISAKVVNITGGRPITMTIMNQSYTQLGDVQTGEEPGLYPLSFHSTENIGTVIFEGSSDPDITEIDGGIREFAYDAIKPLGLENYPHIIDFEPKKRDLYQSATQEDELLTASKSEVNTTKSFGGSENTQTGVSVGGLIGAGLGAAAGALTGGAASAPAAALGSKLGGSINAGLTHQWGETNQDSTVATTDSSRERREKNATTTNISQMYNLLTGYNLGTNQATFLMLPRPHTLQPTDKRTFIRGLRVMEDIQEFFLIVTRPYDPNNPDQFKRLCVEALLETGHIPESDAEPGPEYDLSYEDFEVQHWAFTSDAGEKSTFSSSYIVNEGFVVDFNAKAEDAVKRGIPPDIPPTPPPCNPIFSFNNKPVPVPCVPQYPLNPKNLTIFTEE